MTAENEMIHDMKHFKTKAFISAMIIFIVGFLPILFVTKGKYMYIGDYNLQNISFIHYLAEKWKTGFPAWDWNSDLGMNFISSYTFYGLFSPIVLVCALFPDAMIWYVLGIVNCLVIASSSVTSCLYIRRYVKKDSSAYICGLLYAFSGYQLFTLFFMFSDVIALFPLLLYAFDRLIHERKSLLFAVMLAVCGIVNYFFLWGECVFLLIYFIVKLVTKQFRLDLKLFMKIAFETLVGVLLVTAVLLPNLFYLMNNSRASQLIFDKNLLAYSMPVIWKVVQSVFFMPDMCAGQSLFEGYDINVGSVSLFIPLFVFVGVISTFRKNRKSWYSVLMLVCALIVCIPLLNSIFTAFNAQFYARWFVMPLLILIMMTGKYIDEMGNTDIKPELRLHLLMMTVFAAYGFFLFIRTGEVKSAITFYYWNSVLYSFLAILILYLIVYHDGKTFISGKNIRKILCVYCSLMLLTGSISIVLKDAGFYLTTSEAAVYNDGKKIELDDTDYFRIANKEKSFFDAALMWKYPQYNLFISTVPGSTSKFFSCAGLQRRQNLVYDENNDIYPLLSLLSVKYQFLENPLHFGVYVEPKDIIYYMKTFELCDSVGYYAIYKNPNYIPMGFCYDYYVSEKVLNNKVKKEDPAGYETIFNDPTKRKDGVYSSFARQLIMLKGIVLTDEQIEKYGDILKELPKDKMTSFSLENYQKDCEDRRKTAAYEFTPNDKGFKARIDLEKDNLVFFSVPYDKGFKAYVDNEETVIEEVFGGLCAVKVPKGDHEIVFEYTVLGAREGIIVSCIALALLLIYAAGVFVLSRKKKTSAGAAEPVQSVEEPKEETAEQVIEKTDET